MLHIKFQNNKVKVVYPGHWQLILNLENGEISPIPGKPFPSDDEIKELRTGPVFDSLYSLYEKK